MAAKKVMSDESMMRQAQHIWSMLDDMSNNDPTAYRRFIDKHIKEGKESMRPPEPHMCVKTRIMKGKELFIINICSWHRIPEPKTDQDPIPVMGGALYQPEQVPGNARAVAVAFNPQILEELGIDSTRQDEQAMLVNLAIDYIQDQHKLRLSRSYSLLPKGTCFKGSLQQLRGSFKKKTESADEQFEKELGELEKSFGPMAAGCKDSLLNQISNLTTGESQSTTSEQLGNQSKGLTHNMADPKISLPGDEVESSRGGLIEELGHETPTEPEYSVTREEQGGGGTVVVRIQLPGVSSVADCDLDVSQGGLHLVAAGRYQLSYTFPASVDDQSVGARFFKKSCVLAVTARLHPT